MSMIQLQDSGGNGSFWGKTLVRIEREGRRVDEE